MLIWITLAIAILAFIQAMIANVRIDELKDETYRPKDWRP